MPMLKPEEPLVIKKFANPRLFNTGAWTYVSLEDVSLEDVSLEDVSLEDVSPEDLAGEARRGLHY